eukprot:1863378-Alexandrium_andersonii.AAC.1
MEEDTPVELQGAVEGHLELPLVTSEGHGLRVEEDGAAPAPRARRPQLARSEHEGLCGGEVTR